MRAYPEISIFFVIPERLDLGKSESLCGKLQTNFAGFAHCTIYGGRPDNFSKYHF